MRRQTHTHCSWRCVMRACGRRGRCWMRLRAARCCSHRFSRGSGGLRALRPPPLAAALLYMSRAGRHTAHKAGGSGIRASLKVIQVSERCFFSHRDASWKAILLFPSHLCLWVCPVLITSATGACNPITAIRKSNVSNWMCLTTDPLWLRRCDVGSLKKW